MENNRRKQDLIQIETDAHCARCRTTHRNNVFHRCCPACQPNTWIPFTSIILSYYIHLTTEQLEVAEVSAFVHDFIKSNNIHFGRNVLCPRSQKLVPGIPIYFIFSFLVAFDQTILFLRESPAETLESSRIAVQKPFYFLVQIICNEHHAECLLLPYKVARHVLEYCKSLDVSASQSWDLGAAIIENFVYHFNHHFFTSTPSIAGAEHMNAGGARMSLAKASPQAHPASLLKNSIVLAQTASALSANSPVPSQGYVMAL
ncbi:hypothetical protein HDU91_000442 [Kappamyces sp. JEL0680]|nr:hypothetical protein HDU91_000442 [Kappamyces sp. JEL0680]